MIAPFKNNRELAVWLPLLCWPFYALATWWSWPHLAWPLAFFITLVGFFVAASVFFFASQVTRIPALVLGGLGIAVLAANYVMHPAFGYFFPALGGILLGAMGLSIYFGPAAKYLRQPS